jgi:hypothetical protein
MGIYERLTELSRMKTEGSLTDEQYATLVELAKLEIVQGRHDGWYKDPSNLYKLRYFHKGNWTLAVSDSDSAQEKSEALLKYLGPSTQTETLAPPGESANKQESKSSNLSAFIISKSNEHVQKMGNFTANKFAQIVSSLAFVLLILGVIGSIIIGFTPSEECYDLFSSEYCEKDWTTSLTMGLVCLLLNSLVMLSIMMVALYIQERTSTTEE